MFSAVALLAATLLCASTTTTQAMFLPQPNNMDASNCPVTAPPMQNLDPTRLFTSMWIAVQGTPIPANITCLALNFNDGFDTNSKTAHGTYDPIVNGQSVSFPFDLVQDASSSNAVYNFNMSSNQTTTSAQLTVIDTNYTDFAVLAQCVPMKSQQSVVVLTRNGYEPSNLDAIKQKLAAAGFPVDDANFSPYSISGCGC